MNGVNIDMSEAELRVWLQKAWRLLKRTNPKMATYAALADAIGTTDVYASQILKRQVPASKDQASKLRDIVITLQPYLITPKMNGHDLVHLLQRPVFRHYSSEIAKEPTIYRLQEASLHYGETIKELINERLGDGIMSGIDFKLSVDVVKGPNGEDRVVVTYNGKFLPYKNEA